jgi:hypothetical protein
VTARFRRPAVRSLTTAGGLPRCGGCRLVAAWEVTRQDRGGLHADRAKPGARARAPEVIIEPNDDGLEIPPWPPPLYCPEHDDGMLSSSLFWMLLTVLATVWGGFVKAARHATRRRQWPMRGRLRHLAPRPQYDNPDPRKDLCRGSMERRTGIKSRRCRVTEIQVAVHALNRMLELGRPNYVRIA